MVQEAKIQASFHGEEWYQCPNCKKFSFEYYDAEFEHHGIKKTDEANTYICPVCKEKFKIS